METYKRNQNQLSQCYFCGEEMSSTHLEIHVKHCGCVLEPCPQNCGLYVQRQYKNHHSSWCKKDPTKQPQWKVLRTELDSLKEQLEHEMFQRKRQEEELFKYSEKMAQTEELNVKLIDAVTGLRKIVADEQSSRLKDVLEVKTSVSESSKHITQLKFTLNQTRVDVEELRSDIQSNEQYEKMYEQFQSWKTKHDDIISEIKMALDKDVHAEINKLNKDNVMRSKSVNDLLDLNEVIIDTQDKYTDQIFQLEEDLKGFKKLLVEENIMISGIWQEQLEEIKKLKLKFDETEKTIQDLKEDQKQINHKIVMIENLSKDLNNFDTGGEKLNSLERTISEDLIKELIDDRNIFRQRLESLEVTTRSGQRSQSTDTCLSVFDDTIVKQQTKIAQRLETLERLTTEVQNNCNKRNSSSTNNEQPDLFITINELSSEQAIIKRRLDMLEILTQELEEVKVKLSSNKLTRSDNIASINGRLMWTISNFSQRLDELKETKYPLESPCFYTSETGYKLQLRAHLNGLGQWEGRHMIISLHVLSAPWDARLAWPVRLKVVMCLRDQELIHRKAKDIIKSFTSSPASKGFDSPCLQMFIPHRTLYTRSYLKNNVLIIEVKTFPL